MQDHMPTQYEILVIRASDGYPIHTLHEVLTPRHAGRRASEVELEFPGCYGRAYRIGKLVPAQPTKAPKLDLSRSAWLDKTRGNEDDAVACEIVGLPEPTRFRCLEAARAHLDELQAQFNALPQRPSLQREGDTLTITRLFQGKAITRHLAIEPL